MDFLGSILDKMEKPPGISEKQKAMIKKQKEEQEKLRKLEAEKLKEFRKKVEAKIKQFLDNVALKEYKFQPMEKIYRSIIHDVAEMSGVYAYSFGEEGVDRYIMIFKKEYPPSDDQLNALKRGEEWNEEIAKELQAERERKAKEDAEYEKNRKKEENFTPTTNYKDKYEHLIGKEAALEAARKTVANSSYGFVPSSNKRDQRSIEQTLADLRAKRKKLEEDKKSNEESDKKEESKAD